MTRYIYPILFIVFCVVASCTQEEEQTSYAFRNGSIYTMEQPGQMVEALVTQGERIVFTGNWEDAQSFITESTQVVDLNGKTLLPGFTDAHVHPISGGLALMGCNLSGIGTADSILFTLKQYADAHPEKEWIQADNFGLSLFPDGNPRKEWLDSIISDRPVYVTSSDAHSAWVNAKALEAAGITNSTPDPVNGKIERDMNTGEPAGTLREDAMDMVKQLIPAYTHEELVEGLRKGLEVARSHGITNFIEASGRANYMNAYVDLAERKELTAHVTISIYADISKGMGGAREALALNEKYKGRITSATDKPDLTFNQVKLFMDGVVEGKTAAMLSPYEGETNAGQANTSADTATAVITFLDKAGLQVHVHAIGDRAIRMTLDAFEHAREVNGIRDSRHHMAHLHVVHPNDLARFGELDVTANFQALWATLEDSYMTDLNFPFLGKERIEWQYPMGSIARAGGRLAFGSDWDVSTMNPFDAMQVAVTRRGPDTVAREAWTPQHLTDVQTVVEGYTRGGAYLTFREDECGTLTVGKLADLILIDRDIFSISKFEIHQTEVLATLFRGEIVFGDLP